ECWSDGGCHSFYIRRENTALAAARAIRCGCCACGLWCTGDFFTSTAPHLPGRWRRDYARRDADEDAREVADRILDVGGPNVRLWPIADIPSCTAHVRFWG